jgi:hypothetical protein
MPPKEQEINDLAKLIYVERLGHLGASDWDFRPHAVKAFDAAHEFFAHVDEQAPVPSNQQIKLTVEPGSDVPPPAGAPTAPDAPAVPVGTEPQSQSQGAVHPGVPDMPLPSNQPA